MMQNSEQSKKTCTDNQASDNSVKNGPPIGKVICTPVKDSQNSGEKKESLEIMGGMNSPSPVFDH